MRLEVGGLGWAGLHDYQPVRSDEVGMVAPTCDPSTRGLGAGFREGRFLSMMVPG